jgi:MFS family permease
MGIGFTYFLGEPANEALQTEVSPSRSRGLAFGLIFSIGAFPGALAPLVFGSLGDIWGLSASVLFLATTTALAAVVSLVLRENNQRTRLMRKEHA